MWVHRRYLLHCFIVLVIVIIVSFLLSFFFSFPYKDQNTMFFFSRRYWIIRSYLYINLKKKNESPYMGRGNTNFFLPPSKIWGSIWREHALKPQNFQKPNSHSISQWRSSLAHFHPQILRYKINLEQHLLYDFRYRISN